MNTSGDPEGLVKRGNERVLKARFNDARFFWDVDQQKKLADRVQDLKKVTFQAKLGSYFEKTDRVVAPGERTGRQRARASARLCLRRRDLTTEMVKEFTDLQGIVGGLYAQAQGEPEPVWTAIYEHYKPLSMEDSIPETREGQIVSLCGQAGYAARMLQGRDDADRFERSVRAAARGAGRGEDSGGSEASIIDFYALFASPN